MSEPSSDPIVAQIHAFQSGKLADILGIEVIVASPERMVMRMPVQPRVMQPEGVVHGGATVALAETAASVGTWLGIDQSRSYCVGLEINCNHLRAVREGVLTAEATPVHRGRTTWVWDIRIHDQEGRLTAISRCTMAVVARRGDSSTSPGV